jgi:hypothetical protein
MLRGRLLARLVAVRVHAPKRRRHSVWDEPGWAVPLDLDVQHKNRCDVFLVVHKRGRGWGRLLGLQGA